VFASLHDSHRHPLLYRAQVPCRHEAKSATLTLANARRRHRHQRRSRYVPRARGRGTEL